MSSHKEIACLVPQSNAGRSSFNLEKIGFITAASPTVASQHQLSCMQLSKIDASNAHPVKSANIHNRYASSENVKEKRSSSFSSTNSSVSTESDIHIKSILWSSHFRPRISSISSTNSSNSNVSESNAIMSLSNLLSYNTGGNTRFNTRQCNRTSSEIKPFWK
jgi:hypothetical protein